MPEQETPNQVAEPILMECEGSGCPIHRREPFKTIGICAMCGEWVIGIGDDYDLAEPHERKDILAMLERGDFDA